MAATIERRFTTGKAAGVEVRAAGAGGGPGTLVGYAATYYDPADTGTEYDLKGYGVDAIERILPGALRSALAPGRDVRSTFDHQDSVLLGRTASGTLRLAEDKRGLRYEVDLPDTQAGRDLAVQLKRGDVWGSSFEFSVGAVEWGTTPDGRRVRGLKQIEVYQVGPVIAPAYGATTAEVRGHIEAEAAAALAAPEPRAQPPAPSPESPEAMKAKADQQAAASKALADGQARARLLDLKERE